MSSHSPLIAFVISLALSHPVPNLGVPVSAIGEYFLAQTAAHLWYHLKLPSSPPLSAVRPISPTLTDGFPNLHFHPAGSPESPSNVWHSN